MNYLEIFNTVTEPCSAEEIAHYFRVAASFSHDDPCDLVALYHDVVEDGYIKLDDLKRVAGLTDEEAEAIDALTRRPAEQYMDYIKRLSSNPIAVKVKLADLKDNKERCQADIDRKKSMLKRYTKAEEFLLSL